MIRILREGKRKLIFTVREFRKTAYHHYGKRWVSLIKFLYISVLRINTFIVLGADLSKDLPIYYFDEEHRVIKPTLEELDKIRAGLDLPREFYYDKIHGVKRCYLVLYRSEPVYIHWVYFKGDPNRFLQLSKSVAELNYNTTLIKFRGRGLMGKMAAFISNDLKKEGYKKVVGVVHERNPAALKSLEKAGWSEIARIKTFGPFNRKVLV